jgi:hypothetical protein
MKRKKNIKSLLSFMKTLINSEVCSESLIKISVSASVSAIDRFSLVITPY